MGDANLCANKWNNPKFLLRNVAAPLKIAIDRCGLKCNEIGNTYQSDHLMANGTVAESAIDHVYSSKTLEDKLEVKKLPNGSSDHNPVITKFQKPYTKKIYLKSITKRSMKNFSKSNWNTVLRKQDWNSVEESEDLNTKVKLFTTFIDAAMDEIAPIKTFTVKSNYRFGLSENTKKLMKQRDVTRSNISKANNQQKTVLMKKYKILRNKTTASIRKDSLNHNQDRIDNAKNEKEIWNIVNDVTNPRKEVKWKLKTESGTETDQQKIADTFNSFFIEKIESLKKNIDQNLKEDPLEKLKMKFKDKNLKFELKTVSHSKVAKALRKMKKKKSAGVDGLSQESLVLGTDVLVNPLTSIVNCSITIGEFPADWKEALVTPVLKKGNPETKENYRPVSCLPAGSKLLEIIVCEQTTQYMEEHKLLPENQHGFRAKRSTMTAWANIQQDWARNSEKNLITGVMLWDLSAAFDTLDADILINKLEVYGFSSRSRSWFESFLTNRSQKVKIGSCVSRSVKLNSGVPQGGILSPLLYIIYVADLEDWLIHSAASTYADDTETGVSGTDIEEIKAKLEEDGNNVLRYMASNGLVANPKKTALVFINLKHQENPITIKIGGEEITQEKSAKLLGITFDDDLKWNSQIHGKGGLVSSLNQRLFGIRRLKNTLKYDGLIKVADSLFTSKLRYGLQLMGQVRWKTDDVQTGLLETIQKSQNKLLRFLNNTQIKDKVSNVSMLKKHKMLSVNQLNAQIKLTEIWKALADEDHPFKISKPAVDEEERVSRAQRAGIINSTAFSKVTKDTFINDSIKAWNNAPQELKNNWCLSGAKTLIKKFVMTLPV